MHTWKEKCVVLICWIEACFSGAGQVDAKVHGEKNHIEWLGKILKSKNSEMELTLPVIKMHYKSSIIEIIWYWHMYRWKDYWNETEIQETDPKTYGNHI